MATATEKRTKRKEAIALLQKWIAKGATVYTTVTHVARSGMSRRIRVFIIHPEYGDIWNISNLVATAMGDNCNDQGIRVDGCGMDMGFHLVYSLGHTLFGPMKTGEDDPGYYLVQKWL